MRKIFLLLLCVSFYSANAQEFACCMKSPLTSSCMDAAFKASHESPLPFDYDAKGKMITYKTADGKTANAYELQASNPTDKWLFVFHEYWGLNNYIKQRADELQKDLSVNVLAIDVYDGQVTTNPDEAGKIMKGLNGGRVQNILKGAYDYVGKDAKVATIGWCMGGLMSVNSAIAGGKNVIGCVTYYGIPDVTVEQLRNLNCSIRGLFAEKDQWINADVVNKFDEKMKQAGKQFPESWYHADHAFANPSNPHYNKEEAERANVEAMSYLKKTFWK